LTEIREPDPLEYPYCYSGHEYARQVVDGEIPACKYVIGACERYFRDLENPAFKLDHGIAERYLRLVQQFEHTIGKWNTEKILYEPWQNFIFMNIIGFINLETGYRRFRIAHIEVGRGNGKANWIETPVPTPEGMKVWKDIKVGDTLFGRDGRACKVVGKTPTTFQKAYKVIFSDGSEVVCSGEHEWITSNKTERDRAAYQKSNPPKRKNKSGVIVSDTECESIRETKDILKTLKYGKETNHSIENCKPTIGERKLTKINPYYLGYWIGNGSSCGAELSCHRNDSEELSKLLQYRGVDAGIYGYQKTGNGALVRVLKTRTVLRELNQLKNKHIPPESLTWDLETRLEFIRGLLDSDGTIDRSGVVEFYSSEFKIASGFKTLISSLGYKPVLSEKIISENNNFKTSKKHFRVAFTARGDLKLFNFKRKYDRQISSRGKHTYATRRYVTDILELENNLEMFCVEVDSPDSTYLISESYIPTHNSPMASQMALYFLAMDNPVGNEISCFATKSEQAKIVLNAARNMAKKSQGYRSQYGVRVLAHEILHEKSNSKVRAMSADSKSMDGLNDVLSIMDELHAMDRSLFDVVYSGNSKRRDSLMLCITTAGFSNDSIGYSQSMYARKLCLNEITDDQMFAIAYTVDEGDDIFSEEAWRKANPNFGVSVDPTTFAAKAQKAQETPSDLPNFKVKHLNVWQLEAQAFYDQQKWDVCGDVKVTFEMMRGKKAMVGIDIASKIDLTSQGFVFYDEGKYILLDRSYLPEKTVQEAKSVLYDQCIAEGQLIATPGEAIDYSVLQADLLAVGRDIKILDVMYDPWNASSFAQDLAKERLNVVEFRFNTANLSEPTKSLDALMRQKKIVHNNSQLLRWCLGNVVAREDAAGNVFPRKTHEKFKIDPIIALLMALAGWLRNEPKTSVYETRGILRLGG
jgi:phage terminase large subunit-like protein